MFRGKGIFPVGRARGGGVVAGWRGAGTARVDVWSVVPCKRQERSPSE